MIGGIFSRLARVRFTVGYVAALLAISCALLALGPHAHDVLVQRASTNLHNLARGHVGTLLGSALVVDAGPLYFWLPFLTCLLALAELHLRTIRLVVAFLVGHIVKRMGDGLMAVFRDPTVALRAVLAAKEALRSVEVAGYTPRMRVGIHTGRPQRMAADWLGVDVNVAARVMERATKGGIMLSSSTLDQIPQTELQALGTVAKRVRKPVFAGKTAGIPADLGIYRLKTLRELTAFDHTSETN